MLDRRPLAVIALLAVAVGGQNDTDVPTYAPTAEPTNSPTVSTISIANMEELNELLNTTKKSCVMDMGIIDGQNPCKLDVLLAAGKYWFSTHYDMDNTKGEYIFTGTDGVIFDGGLRSSFFNVFNGHLKVEGITFQNGYSGVKKGTGYPRAAIDMRGGTLEALGCSFESNRAATYGAGAVYVEGPKVSRNKMHLISDTKFIGNSAGAYGGDSLYACDTLVLLNKVEFMKGEGGTQTTYNLCEYGGSVTKIQHHQSGSFYSMENECRGGVTESFNCSDNQNLGINTTPWKNALEWKAQCISGAGAIGSSVAMFLITTAVSLALY
jgi:hypothetical protein